MILVAISTSDPESTTVESIKAAGVWKMNDAVMNVDCYIPLQIYNKSYYI